MRTRKGSPPVPVAAGAGGILYRILYRTCRKSERAKGFEPSTSSLGSPWDRGGAGLPAADVTHRRPGRDRHVEECVVPPGPALTQRANPVPRWFVALDADEAGELASAAWLDAYRRAVRARPPGSNKDWTEAHLDGVNLRRWWTERLSGIESPALFT